jgi:hypothetical protein
VPTSALNQAIKRNRQRFPTDFMFQLTREETAILRSQDVTLEVEGASAEELASNSSRIVIASPDSKGMRSQIVTGSPGAKDMRSQIAAASIVIPPP